jgi:histidinol-phosphatase
MQYQLDLDHALQLADVADTITMPIYRSNDLQVTDKPDNTPVTKGDLEVEKQLSAIVTEQFKEGFYGEEGTHIDNSERVWTLDPIDGTKNFLRGLPIWATLISLAENGETVAAVVSAPALGRRWWAAKGLGAWTRDVDGLVRQIHVSKVPTISDAFLLGSTPLSDWDKTAASEQAVQQLFKEAWRWRLPGDMVNYMWVAEGAADACFEPHAKLWDVAAPRLIVLEAGGTFVADAKPDTPPEAERAILATNGHLEAYLRAALKL